MSCRIKAVLLVLVSLLITNCATHKAYNYADFHSSLQSGMTFYTQYEILYKANTKDGDKLVVAPFLADSNNYLPGKVIKLHLGLIVNNPSREKFVIWIDYQFLGIDDGKVFKRSKLAYKAQGLPEEFISIDMPFDTNMHSKVKFAAEVVSNGVVLYKSTEALYKIKGS